MLSIEPEALRAAASRWQLVGAGLGESSAPPVSLAMSWPSAAAANNIHAQAATATGSFQTRIEGNAAASNKAANAFQNHETMKAGDIKDVMSPVTSPLHDVIGIAGSVGSASSSIAGTIGQLGGQAVSVTTNLTSALTGALSHVGSSPQSMSMPIDHELSHGGSQPQTASIPSPTDHPENPSQSSPNDQRPTEI
ncbi:MAG: hypothetical protein WA488_24790 [Mycobacterium sp.]|uniref:hypothetical protein n=1 Tax=Mycobacterium sp. TaxID=1785 RepID=UPI003BB6E16A